MLLRGLWLSCFAVAGVYAQSSVDPNNVGIGTIAGGDVVRTSKVMYLSYPSTISAPSSTFAPGSVSGSSSSGQASSIAYSGPSATSQSLTPTSSSGGKATASGDGTGHTPSAPLATSTQPCNNYAKFCTRSYGNITQVCAHNSPFVRDDSIASNQMLGVIAQLNDGIRMRKTQVQGQTHMVNDIIYLCHTSCNLLNAGTLESYLTTVAGWVEAHPYDVVTILIANGDYNNVRNFVAPIQNSGLGPYLYEPPKIPMGVSDWPTLSDMILAGKRVVVFMDYKANQQEVPYILDEFSQIWETPFNPTNRTFPCTVQRPPGLNREQALKRMYLTNHNLNVEINYLDINILIPDITHLNVTNGVTGQGSLGVSTKSCTDDWGRPPNWLLVDYYNYGNPIHGSVFEVAAMHNNVTYNRKCCGLIQSFAPKPLRRPGLALAVVVAVAFAIVL